MLKYLFIGALLIFLSGIFAYHAGLNEAEAMGLWYGFVSFCIGVLGFVSVIAFLLSLDDSEEEDDDK